MPSRPRKSRGKKLLDESDEEEFVLSAGDIASDLDFEESIPQRTAGIPKAKTTSSRPSGIGVALKKPPMKQASAPARHSAPVKATTTKTPENRIDTEDQVIGGGFNTV